MNKIVALVTFLFVWSLTTHGKYSATGDEPHYLMITQSVVADHDLDLANNYANDEGRLFGHDHLVMGPHARADRQGRVASVHDIGLPLLLVGPYVTARWIADRASVDTLTRFRMDRGLFTYSLISVILIALTAVGMGLLADAAIDFSGTRSAAWLVGLAAISPPMASHAFLIFPEAIALFLTALVVWFSTRHDQNDAIWLPWIAAALGLLPWVHRKYSLYVIGLLFLIVWLRRDVIRAASRGGITTAAALFIAPQIAFHLWTIVEWGAIGGPQLAAASPFSVRTLAAGLPGMWLDGQSGVLAYAPLYWIVPLCWITTWRRTWPYFVPALLLYVPMASFVEWWGGFAPAGRYLVPILPLCLMPVAASLRSRAIAVLVIVLAVPQVMIDAICWQHPRFLWPAADRVNPLLTSLGPAGRAYLRVLLQLRGFDG
jgi:hypothetical protein